MVSSFKSGRMVRAHRVLYLVTLATAAMVLAGLFVPIDIVARGAGQFSPADFNTLMKSPREGVIQTVAAKNGDWVKAGARLARFDCAAEEGILAALEAQAVLARASLANKLAVADQTLSKAQLGDIHLRYDRHIDARTAVAQGEAQAKVDVMQREAEKIGVAQKQWASQQSGLVAKVAAAHSAAALAQAQLERQRNLRSQGFIADAALETAENDAHRAAAALQASVKELESLRADVNFNTSAEVLKSYAVKDELYSSLAGAAAVLTDLETQKAKAVAGVRHCDLLAPVDGQLFWINELRQGAWQKMGDPLFKIVPQHRRLVVEARFRDSDIAYIRQGQKAYVKVDGLPFIKYGTLAASIQFVSPDTVVADTNGGLYRATLVVNAPENWALSNGVELKAGLGITVDVVTGQRRLYEYFFGPVLDAIRMSFQER